jgi:hypothetical protein
MLRGWFKAASTVMPSDVVPKWLGLGGGLAAGKLTSP